MVRCTCCDGGLISEPNRVVQYLKFGWLGKEHSIELASEDKYWMIPSHFCEVLRVVKFIKIGSRVVVARNSGRERWGVTI